LLYVVGVHPDNVDAYRGLAKIHYERGALTLALKHLEQWSRLAPEDGEPHRWMGLVFDRLVASAPAVEQYKLALSRKLSPQLRDEVRVDLAELLIKQGDGAEALATAAHPGDPVRTLRH
jgi:Flp pilus assembly protein TadD